MKGCFPAIATPFLSSGNIDFDSFANLTEHVISGGVSGIFVAGSTGEGLTLTSQEYVQVLTKAKELTKGRVPLFSGISSSATHVAVDMAKIAKELKYDGILVATPPYNKPTQDGIIAHMKAISKASGLPIVAYNVPGRTCTPIQPQTLASLYKDKIICAVKDATGSLDNALEILNATNRQLSVLSGEDSLAHSITASGGTGLVSVIANAFPKEFSELIANALSGNIVASLDTQLRFLPLIRALFSESNPIPLKYTLYKLGIIKSPLLREPLLEATSATRDLIDGLLGKLKAG